MARSKKFPGKTLTKLNREGRYPGYGFGLIRHVQFKNLSGIIKKLPLSVISNDVTQIAAAVPRRSHLASNFSIVPDSTKRFHCDLYQFTRNPRKLAISSDGSVNLRVRCEPQWRRMISFLSFSEYARFSCWENNTHTRDPYNVSLDSSVIRGYGNSICDSFRIDNVATERNYNVPFLFFTHRES